MLHKVIPQLGFYGSMALLLVAAACNMPIPAGSETPLAAAETGSVTGESPASSTPALTATRTPSATAIPTATETATPEPTATIVHVLVPGAPPVAALSEIIDHDSSLTASQRRTTAGENFAINLFERPFDPDPMDVYFPDLDIKRARLSMDATWVYVTLNLVGLSPDGDLTGNYGVELDLNLDGRGDVLVLASGLQQDWSTDGVRVWEDANHDVGHTHPLLPDTPPSGDGFELMIFDQGRVPAGVLGVDPDSAWARLSPNDPASLQLAFKKAVIANDGTFLWGGWADLGLFEPGWYDYNDHFTHTEAGSPLAELSSFYPLKALFEIDNTCRWSVGFTPIGTEPGICPVPGTSQGTATRTPTRTPTRSFTPQQGATATSTRTRTNTPFNPNTGPSSTPTRTNTPFSPPTGPSSTPTVSPTRPRPTFTPSSTPAGVPNG